MYGKNHTIQTRKEAPMPTYPKWVEGCRREKTVIRKTGEGFLLYSTTSHRVPGKRKSQVTRCVSWEDYPRRTCAGLEVNVDHSDIRVYEYSLC